VENIFSNEISSYLQYLDIDILELQLTDIKKFKFSSQNGRVAKALLPLESGINRLHLIIFIPKN